MILTPFLALTLSTLTQQPAPTPLLPARPRDPFVFRCVLDQHPRMITAALDDDMWVAWDATNCGLYKAWKGGVNFDGPVYTTVHGPQPTARGGVYTSGSDSVVWTVLESEKPVAAQVIYGGYTVEAGRVAVEWRLVLGPGREIVVTERPEFVRPRQFMNAAQLDDAVLGEGLQPGLQRRFEATGIPADVGVYLSIRTDGVVAKFATALERERFEDVKDKEGRVTATRVWSQMPLTRAAPKNVVMLIFQPIVASAESQAPTKREVK